MNPDTHEIEAETLTENSCDDASQVDNLLDQATNEVGGFYGDGAYDKRKTYETLGKRRIRAIIPPQRNAKIWQHGNSGKRPLSRNAAIRAIRRRLGRRSEIAAPSFFHARRGGSSRPTISSSLRAFDVVAMPGRNW